MTTHRSRIAFRQSIGFPLALMLCLASAPAAPRTNVRAAEPPVIEMVGQLGGFVTVMAIDGDYAYVATGPRLTVLDVSGAGELRAVGTSEILDVHGPFHYLAVGGDVVFGSVRGNPIQVIDVSLPVRPRVISTFPPAYGGGAIAAADGHLFVAQGTNLLAFDVADPLDPQLVSTTAVYAYTTQLLVHGDLLFVVADNARGMLVLDVGDPAAPTVVKWFEAVGISAVAVGAGLVYLTVTETRALPEDPTFEAHYQMVKVLDGSPTSGFAELGRLDLGSVEVANVAPIEAVVAVGRTVCISAQNSMIVVDAFNPAAPAEIARFRLPPNTTMGSANPRLGIAYPGRVVAAGSRLYVTFDEYMPDRAHSFESGVVVYSVFEPTNPTEVGAWTQAVPGNVADLAVVGDLLLVGDIPSNRLRVYDIANRTMPRLVSMIEVDTSVRDFAADGHRLLILGGGHDMQLLDLTDPAQPTLIARREVWRATAVEMRGDIIFAAFYGPGETGDDVGQLATLRMNANGEIEDLYHLEGVPRAAIDLVLHGDTLILAQRSEGLTLLDVGNPVDPKVVGSIDTPHFAMGMTLVDDMAYLAVKLPTPEDQRDQPVRPTWGGVMLVDVATPDRPAEAGLLGFHLDDYRGNVERWGMGVTDGIALLAASEGYVRAFDVRDPAAPRELQKLRVPGVVGALATTGDYAYVAGQDAGLLILKVNGGRGTAEPASTYVPVALRGR